MSSPWEKNIFTSLVKKVSLKRKKKTVAATPDVPLVSKDQGSRCIVNESLAAIAAQRQVQHHQNLRRSPAPFSTPIAMSSSCTQAASSRPNSHTDASFSQDQPISMSSSCSQAASSRPNFRTDASFSQDHSFGISGSGSAISLAGLSRTSASSLSVTVNPTLGTLPTMTSSVILADYHNPTALRLSEAGENGNN